MNDDIKLFLKISAIKLILLRPNYILPSFLHLFMQDIDYLLYLLFELSPLVSHLKDLDLVLQKTTDIFICLWIITVEFQWLARLYDELLRHI